MATKNMQTFHCASEKNVASCVLFIEVGSNILHIIMLMRDSCFAAAAVDLQSPIHNVLKSLPYEF